MSTRLHKRSSGDGTVSIEQERVPTVHHHSDTDLQVLTQLHGLCSARRGGKDVEVIVVDGGSADETRALSCRQGAKVILGTRGRGFQLNAGWRAASGQWCIFLHGDSRLPEGYRKLLTEAVDQSNKGGRTPVWGCFKTIKTEFCDSVQGRLLSAGVELRTRLLHMPYGDQAIFVQRDTLKSLGGLKDWPLLEDVELVDRLKTVSPPIILPEALETSGRRWAKLGFWQTSAINLAVVSAFRCGVDPFKLAEWYYMQAKGVQKQSP